MRLAGIAKGGFYPLPLEMTKYIASSVVTNDGGELKRILDPCAGNGAALIDLAKKLEFRPYACELHNERASETIRGISEIEGCDASNAIQDSYLNIRTERRSFHALYLNPPYDYDKESGREEYTWLKKLNALLGDGGLLIWIIPEKVIADRNVRRFLASWYYDMAAYRFVGESYDTFKQIVVYGRKRATQVKAISRIQTNIKQLSELHANLPEHPFFGTPLYDLSDVRISTKFFFYGLHPTPEAIKVELNSHGVQVRDDFIHAMKPAVKVLLDPLTTMKVGHIASTISAGHINNEKIETEDGDVIIKGSVYNQPITRTSSEDVKGGKTKTRTVTVFDPRAVITTIDEKGVIDKLVNNKLAEFLHTNLYAVTNTLKRLYPPRYQFKLKEWKGYLKGINPRRIPNTNRQGLLPAQKHTAAAINEQWLKHRDAILVGQIGTGKTVMSIAAAYAMYNKNNNRDHFIVMCPPHLVSKWLREVSVTWPVSSGMHIVKPSDADRFFATKGPIFGILKSTTASAGAGWEHTLDMDGPLVLAYRKNPKDNPVEIVKANPKIITAHKSSKDDEHYFKHYKYLQSHPIQCPNAGCWAPVMVKDPKNKGGKLPSKLADFTNKRLYCDKCGGPLWQEGAKDRPRRVPIASYIKLKHSGKTDILIVDEAHQYKGEFAARAYAYGRMVRSSKYTLIMTGTIYGGKASTLFFLLFRLSAEFRHSWVAFDRDQHHRMKWKEWNNTYGVMEETRTVTEGGSSAQSSGGRTENRNTKEVAGSSPAMLPWLLNRAIFVSLDDMGIALPNYQEILRTVEMEGEMAVQYELLYRELSAALAQKLVRGDRSLLSKYLNALIYYPDSAWRPKGVKEKGKEEWLVYVPGTQQPCGSHPKEKAILALIKEELAEGRGCLLMVAQSGTLDIQPEWQDMLSKSNISSAILKADPYHREQWIAKQEAKGTQVLISNPKKVETGLDILSYPTIIWMAPEFSIYTVMQASGRAYRLGQTKDCKVYHFAYEDTLQYQAMQLVIAKSAAAKRVNGDTISTDDLADLDRLASDSIENALAKIMVEKNSVNQKIVEIDLDYEKVSDGLFDGAFADCADTEEAKKLYDSLILEHRPDPTSKTKKIETLSTLMDKINAEFKAESQYLGDTSIREEVNEDVDEADVYEEPEVKEETVVVSVVPVVPVAEEISTSKVVIIPAAESGESEVTVERLVFGQSTITVTKRKAKRKVPEGSPAQLSLF